MEGYIMEKVNKVANECIDIVDKYDKNAININLTMTLLLEKRTELIKFYNDNINNLKDDESNMLALLLYTMNSTVTKLLITMNKEIDKLVFDGRLSKKEKISNFDFNWSKQEE